MATSVPAPLAGKVAIVTGGSQGIGACLAETLARQGCTRIAITYHTNKDKAETTCRKIREVSPNIKACAFAADLADAGFGDKVVESALSGLGVDHVDIAISSAVIAKLAQLPPVPGLTKQWWDEVMTGLAWGPLTFARAASSKMPTGGRIIFLSSFISRIPEGGPPTSYSVAKAALEAVSKNLAAEWSISKGITVNSISVGPTKTESLVKAFDTLPGFREHAESFPMLKRLAEEQEVADIVAFVASPQASWLTGNMIPANGGALAMLQG